MTIQNKFLLHFFWVRVVSNIVFRIQLGLFRLAQHDPSSQTERSRCLNRHLISDTTLETFRSSLRKGDNFRHQKHRK